MTSHDVMEATLFKKSLSRGSELQSSRACSMEIKTGFVVHILMLIVGGIRECSATKYITVAEGDTLVLKCPQRNLSENTYMEWRNPNGHVMYFNKIRGLRDSRSKIFTSNNSEYTLLLSNITFDDEGLYKCLLYEDKVISKRFKVKVLGAPKIDMAEYEDKIILKCSVTANGNPPELSWQISGVEIEALPNTLREGRSNRSLAVSILTIKTHIREAKVMCMAKHKDLPKQVLDLIIIENHSITASTSRYSSTRDVLKTETMTTVTSAPAISSTAHMKLSSENTEVVPTGDSTTSNHRREEHSTSTAINLTKNINSSESISPEGFITKNGTNSGFDIGGQDKQYNHIESSPLLILLVTSLIICLLIVVIFFVIRLRRAHIAWKKENEESDQSVESSKSKASHEEKQSQGRRRQGFWNSNFTEYRVEETQQNAENAIATVDVITETQDSSRTACNKLDGACVKETEL
ncbi:cytotoxic and regulatory T-cell molecule isoform X2 [Pimephales promelas]|uniref:cytotoxic and regulatory T-cell molecule isoform X2 n=1 Tax=Pimephales promelas TaxID=90988 RepID=UPI001955C057|nr:cytotoxic and regulatory T-cell molecule isoform X2 [Pimephales promelas]